MTTNTTATPPPPLLKPRHADGRLMTEDEIRALDGEMLRQIVGVCVMGFEHRIMGDDSLFIYLPDLVCHSWSAAVIPRWESDISAAFTVDRSEWQWEMWEDVAGGAFCWSIDLLSGDDVRIGGVSCYVELGGKPSPQEHARARCIAALLLAAKIGE